jgi:hypothetical protein
MEGYIKLYRQIMDNKLWYTRPFAKGQAWVELLMMANHKDNDFLFGNKTIHIERGSFITSILKLSERWGWSQHKTKDFINFLKSCQMLDIKSDNKKSLITIANYTLYQDEEIQKGEVKENKRRTKGEQKETNKNDKNDKNDKKSITIAEIPQKDIYGESKNITLLAVEFEKLNAEFGTDKTKKAIEFLSSYKIEKNYSTKSDYLTMRRWVFKAIENDKPQGKQSTGNIFVDIGREKFGRD